MEEEEKYWDWNKVNSCHQAIWEEERKMKQSKVRMKVSSNKQAWSMVLSFSLTDLLSVED